MPGGGAVGAVGLGAALPSVAGLVRVAPNVNLAPAATLNLSADALSLLSRAAVLPVLGVSASAQAASVSSGLASQLVGAAVLAAVLESPQAQDEKKKRSGALASALVAAAAVSAYRQIANLPGVPVVTPVLGAGVSISITGGA